MATYWQIIIYIGVFTAGFLFGCFWCAIFSFKDDDYGAIMDDLNKKN